MKVPFNQPALFDSSLRYLEESLRGSRHSGGGPFSARCEAFLNKLNGCSNLIVSSATHALEMMPILLEVQPGDEVILPSFTFPSTANAFALRGAKLRFADNDAHGNISIGEVERLLSPKTKVVVAVHYGGSSADMDLLVSLCADRGVALVEDAAQAIGATFRGRPLGTFGALGCYSFHETKNVGCGEGGALILGKPQHLTRAEIVQQKGTNRKQFLMGLIDKYTWVDIGSSFLLSDLNCAYLWSQLERLDEILSKRKKDWQAYWNGLDAPMKQVGAQLWNPPAYNETNHHLFAIVFQSASLRSDFIAFMKRRDVHCMFHYQPLHSSTFGKKLDGGQSEQLPQCDRLASTLVRLPLYFDMTHEQRGWVIDSASQWVKTQKRSFPRPSVQRPAEL